MYIRICVYIYIYIYIKVSRSGLPVLPKGGPTDQHRITALLLIDHRTAHRTQKHSITAHRTQKHSISAHRTQNSCSAGHRNAGWLLSEHRIAAHSTAHSPHRYCFSTAPPLPTVRQHNNDVLLIQCIATRQFSHYRLATHNFPRAGWHDNSLVYIYIYMYIYLYICI